MDLIIGGAYQGKTEFAKEKYGLSDKDICVCQKDGYIDFNKKCISHIERYSFWCVEHDLEPDEYFFEHLADFEHTVIISDDIYCGVVPVDKTERAWREANGRLLIKISDKSEHVTRVFCKIPVVLK